MAINLASKYSSKIAEKFSHESFIGGNINTDFDWAGVRSISIYTPQSVDLTNYDRTLTANRFGTPTELQDTVQELMLTQEPSFSITIDKGNNADQMNTKGAMKMLGMQIREKVTPYMDKYTFKKWILNAGIREGISTAPTKTDIVEKIVSGMVALDSALVPSDNRTVYLPASYYGKVMLSSEFIAIDKLGEKSVEKGVVGTIGDMKIVKVPDSYLPDNTYFLITHKNSVLRPVKLKTARVLTDVAGIDGAVLEGRNYFDAFILAAKANGVYAAVASSEIVAAPSVSISGNSATVTAVSGVKFYYTLDGSDPRYSKTAQEYSAAVTTTAGQTLKVAGKKTATGAWSAVSEKTDA